MALVQTDYDFADASGDSISMSALTLLQKSELLDFRNRGVNVARFTRVVLSLLPLSPMALINWTE